MAALEWYSTCKVNVLPSIKRKAPDLALCSIHCHRSQSIVQKSAMLSGLKQVSWLEHKLITTMKGCCASQTPGRPCWYIVDYGWAQCSLCLPEEVFHWTKWACRWHLFLVYVSCKVEGPGNKCQTDLKLARTQTWAWEYLIAVFVCRSLWAPTMPVTSWNVHAAE